MEVKNQFPIYYGYLIKNDKQYFLEYRIDKLKAYADLKDIKYEEIIIEDNKVVYGNELFNFIDKLIEGDGIIVYYINELSSSVKFLFEILAKTWARKIKLGVIKENIDPFNYGGEFMHTSYYNMSNLIGLFLKPVFLTEDKIRKLKEILNEEEFNIFEEHFQYQTIEEYNESQKTVNHLAIKYYPDDEQKTIIHKIRHERELVHMKPLSKLPYGWKTISGKITQIETEQEIIDKIKTLKEEKLSYIEIARKLNESKIRSPGRSTSWNEIQIIEIINDFYRADELRNKIK